MVDVLQSITASGLCNGCGACAGAVGGGKIRMDLSKDGFYRPRSSLALTPEDQEVVENVCSGIALEHDNTEVTPAYDLLWGHLARVAVGHASDPAVRYRGSSGGVISAICAWLVSTGRVSFVVSTSASPLDPIGNVTSRRYTEVEVIDSAGSRYGPSSPLERIDDHLQRGEKFVFVGKPCDVAALRRIAAIDNRVNELVPYVLSFFCAGVPSRDGSLALLKDMGVKLDDVVTFRYRGDGWPGYARAVLRDGTNVTRDYNSSWGNVLNRHLQFRCKVCADGTGEFADIVCADAWYGVDGYPDFTERDGRSLIIARNAKGAELLSLLDSENVIVTSPLDAKEIELMQPYQASRKRNIFARLLALNLLGKAAPRYRGLGIGKLALQGKYIQQLRNFVGMVRRAWQGKSL